MTIRSNRSTALVLAAGAAFSIASAASAQAPYVVNVSGATLQENFFSNTTSTNDFIGVDAERGDTRSIREGFTAFGQLQLAGSPASTLPQFTGGPFRNFAGTGLVPWWMVQYRAVGSGNGLTELANYGITPATSTAQMGLAGLDAAYINATRFALLGVFSGTFGNAANPGVLPCLDNGAISIGGRYSASPFTLPVDGRSSGNTLIDIAAVDVPSDWFIAVPGTPSFVDKPTQAGYGSNPRTALTTVGVDALFTYPGTATPVAFRNSVAPLPAGVQTFATATAPGGTGVNASTILDTVTVYVPIAAVVNFGVGRQDASISELRQLFTTGRMPSGENLTAVTRDVGSGTRNAFISSLHCDTSWGVGENVGALNVNNTDNAIGSGTIPAEASTPAGAYVPSNKGGSGALETTVINTRLGIGHSGAERGVGSWLTNARLELLAVKDDLSGGTQFVRPTASAVVNNGLIGQNDPTTNLPYTADGYRLAGPAVFATLGDPRNVAAAKGGYGYQGAVETNPGYPAMRNSEAASYINNITRSLEAFVTTGPDANAFSPAERLASTFILFNAVDRIATATDPNAFVVNTNRSPLIETFTLTNPASRLTNPAYVSFGAGAATGSHNPNGMIPVRNVRASGTYSDGTNGSLGFQKVDGTFLANSTPASLQRLNSRNRVAGDFDGNGVRNINDTAQLVAGYRFRTGTNPTWAPLPFTGSNNLAFTGSDISGGSLCPEIIGDFDGNGSFDVADVRYFADGLAIAVSGPSAGKLDRKAGFIAIDTSFAGNLFGTTLVTGNPYANGDARGDVNGPLNRHTRGFAPIGHDGTINAFDIDYVTAQFARNAVVTDGEANWDNNAEAIGFDLSADMNGDLKINQADVEELVTVILGTTLGDVNLDGSTNCDDESIIAANLATTGGWAAGDLTGDGLVNEADLAAYALYGCRADINCDGELNPDDLADYIGLFFSQPAPIAADFNRDGVVNPDDLADYIGAFFGGCGGQ